MTAHDQMRAMLDQLMGTARNGNDETLAVKFDDPRVCKSFLIGCCPHEILASTRMDLGECSKIHNFALRADYEQAVSTSPHKDYFYDLEALDQLSQFIAEADRKTASAKKRLAETQEELTSDVLAKAEKVNELAEKIGETLANAEKLGAEGFVEKSMEVMEEVEKLRAEKATAEADYRSSIPAAQYQQQKLRVCDVCCAYLGIHDNDRRLADHFGGKLHLGFIRIRDTYKDILAKAEDRRRKRRSDQSSNNRSSSGNRKDFSSSSFEDNYPKKRSRSRSRSRERKKHTRRSSREDTSSSSHHRRHRGGDNNDHHHSQDKHHSSKSRRHRDSEDAD